MKTKRNITSMRALQKEKRRLVLQMELEKTEMLQETELIKEALWPFRIVGRFRKTVDAMTDNKLFVLAAQLAWSIFNTARKNYQEKHEARKEAEEAVRAAAEKEDQHSVVDFITQVAKDFMDVYMKKKDTEEL